MARNIIPVDSIRLELINLTVSQLRELLGEEYGPRLSDEGGEQVIMLVRDLAGHQTPPPADDAWTLDKARAIADAQPDTFARCDWDVTAVMKAFRTIEDNLPNMLAWWSILPPSYAVQKGLTFFPQFEEALPFLRFPLGEYTPRPLNQIGPNKKRKALWKVPSVLLANTLDRVLRRPDDSELLPFSRKSPLTTAIHTILDGLELNPPDLPTLSSHIRRWWKKPESGRRLRLGATDGHQLLREAILNQAKTPGAAEALDKLLRALQERQANRPPSGEKGSD